MMSEFDRMAKSAEVEKSKQPGFMHDLKIKAISIVGDPANKKHFPLFKSASRSTSAAATSSRSTSTKSKGNEMDAVKVLQAMAKARGMSDEDFAILSKGKSEEDIKKFMGLGSISLVELEKALHPHKEGSTDGTKVKAKDNSGDSDKSKSIDSAGKPDLEKSADAGTPLTMATFTKAMEAQAEAQEQKFNKRIEQIESKAQVDVLAAGLDKYSKLAIQKSKIAPVLQALQKSENGTELVKDFEAFLVATDKSIGESAFLRKESAAAYLSAGITAGNSIDKATDLIKSKLETEVSKSAGANGTVVPGVDAFEVAKAIVQSDRRLAAEIEAESGNPQVSE